ncbi:hypothetical protein GCM10011409_18790 [Lentibacillus populi]|uniref:Uncharacterized protein n=1 Tax=Lentibacillus populi TaxID=1827502 RepID=A0A9W5TX20_9BACI|nr:hypothetical protein [Lentibacillus populi]GGB41507.1 hypothetical protein GCM10011409_18790 [Lentibacillus populi]
MDQLSLFSELDSTEMVIPADVISPLESNKSVKSRDFKKQQRRWSKYVKSVQDSHHCSWFDARKLLIEHRDNQVPIEMRLVE